VIPLNSFECDHNLWEEGGAWGGPVALPKTPPTNFGHTQFIRACAPAIAAKLAANVVTYGWRPAAAG